MITNPRRLTIRLSAMFLATAPFSLANAQDATLETTQVGGDSETEQRIFNVSEITAESLEREIALNIDDTVRYIPGVDVSNAGRFGDNGFNIRGMESDRVAITVDGLSQGESLDPPTFVPYEFFRSTRNAVELESIKSVSIVKGAHSVTAGSGALGGAVMYTTREPGDFLSTDGNDTAVRLKTGFDGRFDEFMVSTTFANRTGAFESLVQVTYRDGNERDNYGGGDPSITGPAAEVPDPFEYEKTNVLVNLAYDVNDAHRIGFIFENYENDSAIENLSRTDSTYWRRWSDDSSKRARYGIYHEWMADTAAFDTLDWSLDRQEIDTSGITFMDYCSFFFGCDGSNPYLRFENRAFDQEATVFNLDMTKAVELAQVSHALTYGLGYEMRSGETTLTDTRYNGLTPDTGFRPTYPRTDPDFVPKTDTDVLTVYVRDSIALTERFDVLAGLRYDDYQYSPTLDDQFVDPAGTVGDADFSGVSWQIGAAFEFVENHSFIANIGSGFKAPTLQQLYLGTRGNTVDDWDTVPNPNLEAETAVNMELGYEFRYGNNSVRLTAFETDYEDFIEYGTFSRTIDDNGTPVVDEYDQPVNSGEITVEGFEIEGEFGFGDNVYVLLSYSHNEGEYKNDAPTSGSFANANVPRTAGDPLESINPDVVKLGIGYDSPSQQWGLKANIVVTDEKKRSDAEFTNGVGDKIPTSEFLSDSSAVVDLNGYWEPIDNLQFNVSITNLFDEQYFQWQRIRHVGGEGAAIRGAVLGNGLNRYTEPGRAISVSASWQF